jgi:hypothetical protein
VSVTFLTDKRLKSATQDQTVDLIQKFESLNGLNCHLILSNRRPTADPAEQRREAGIA